MKKVIKKDNIHGVLVINKPIGISSNSAVYKIKRALGVKKIGHAGTLDPLASGILVVMIGEATKISSFMMNSVKEYFFQVAWGESRTTDDQEGEVIERSKVIPKFHEIKNALKDFEGETKQIPPKYSALRIGGVPAYKLARKNIDPDLNERIVKINKFDVLENSYPCDEIIDFPGLNENKNNFFVSCGKGTYVRSLARDLAHKLGTVGYASAIKRARSGYFSLKKSIDLESVNSDICEIGNDAWYSIHDSLYHLKKVVVDNLKKDKLLLGEKISHDISGELEEGETVLCILDNKDPVALTSYKSNFLQPFRVFSGLFFKEV